MKDFLTRLLCLGGFIATPALADALEDIAAHGMTVTFRDAPIELTFTPDHKWTDKTGQAEGTWRVDGERVCSSNKVNSVESCIPIPKDKKSGDSFEVALPLGAANVRIN